MDLPGAEQPHTDRRRGGEPRLPAAIALLVAIALYALLPDRLVFGPRVAVPALEVVLLIALVAANPRRMTRENVVLRFASLGTVLLIAVSNTIALGLLVRDLVTQTGSQDGRLLLLAALQIWLTNLIVYGLAFWELDRGGPVVRTQASRSQIPPADFRFSQDENHDAVVEVAAGASINTDWVPGFVDYLYVSCTNSTAFSPTDTMPLSHRVKLMMSAEAISSLLLSVLVIARAVGALS